MFGFKHLHHDPDTGTFQSPAYGNEWPQDGAYLDAECQSPEPLESCTCGIYARRDDYSVTLVDESREAAFIMEGGGEVIVGEMGFRAQRGALRAVVNFGSLALLAALTFGLPLIRRSSARRMVEASYKEHYYATPLPAEPPSPDPAYTHTPTPVSPHTMQRRYTYPRSPSLWPLFLYPLVTLFIGGFIFSRLGLEWYQAIPFAGLTFFAAGLQVISDL